MALPAAEFLAVVFLVVDLFGLADEALAVLLLETTGFFAGVVVFLLEADFVRVLLAVLRRVDLTGAAFTDLADVVMVFLVSFLSVILMTLVISRIGASNLI